MKHWMQKKVPALLFILLAVLLSGCGSSESSYYSADKSYAGSTASAAYYDSPAEAPMPDGDYGWSEETELSTGSSASGFPVNVKIIYTADISLESTEFDESAAALQALVAESGGWFENSYLDNRGSYRSASYTVRVPAENFSAFCDGVGGICQVNSLQRGAEDVGEFYYDTESRLITQQTKLARLQELLAQAKDMEDIITLESAISDTELTIEKLTGTLRHYDSLVGYSTVRISLREVYQLSEVEEPAIGFGAKLSASFRSGTRRLGTGFENFLLGLAAHWAGWLFFLLIVAVIVILIVRGVRKSRARKSAMNAVRPPMAPARPPMAPAPVKPEAAPTAVPTAQNDKDDK